MMEMNEVQTGKNMEWDGNQSWPKTGILQISMKRDIENMRNDFGAKDCKPDLSQLSLVPNFEYQVINLLHLMMRKHHLFRTEKPSLAYFGSLEQVVPTSSTQWAKSRFSHQLDCMHVTAVKKVMRYLEGTMDLTLTFRKTPLSLQLNLWWRWFRWGYRRKWFGDAIRKCTGRLYS